MKIYVKEIEDFTIQMVRPLFNSEIEIRQFISLKDVFCGDYVMISKKDGNSIINFENNHVLVYEDILEKIFIQLNKVYQYNLFVNNRGQGSKDNSLSKKLLPCSPIFI